jgi:ABC-type phosphate transport system substrate-binding protein
MKKLLVLAVLACVLAACSGGSDESAMQESATSGTMEILCDESVYDFLQPAFAAFDSAYPEAHVTVRPVSAREAVRLLLADSTRGIITVRSYLRDEDSLMKAFNVTRPEPMPFAIDALVFYTSKTFPLDTVSLDQLKMALRGEQQLNGMFPQLAAEPVFILPDVNSSVYGNVLNLLTNNTPPQHALQFVASQKEVRETVLSQQHTIGVGYLSFVARDTANLKLLRIGYADSTGKYIAPRTVHQAYVYMQQYPLPVAIRGIMAEDRRNLPWGFFSFISRNTEVQKYFNSVGIVPAFANIRLVEPE